MKSLSIICFTAALAVAAPAFAQNDSTTTNSNGSSTNSGPNSTGAPGVMPNNSGTGTTGTDTSGMPTNGNTTNMSNSGTNSMSGGSGSSMSASNTCQGMMDQMNAASGTQTATATREMKLAQAAQAKGQEKTCMTHMRKAMNAMH